MSTLKQKIAARANGAKSRGPATDAGKQISSRNAIRHGMLAKSVLLEPEHPGHFDELVANLYEEHEPSTETERALVETMAVCRWRQMRFWGLEKAIVTQEMRHNDHLAAPDAPLQTLPEKASQAVRTLAASGNGLQLILRYEAQSFRTFLRCLKTLNELQEVVPENKNPENKKDETNPIVDFPEQIQTPAEAEPESPAVEQQEPPSGKARAQSHKLSPDPQIPFKSNNSVPFSRPEDLESPPPSAI